MFNMPLAVAPHATPPTPAAPPKQSTASVTTTAMLVNAASYDAASTLAWSKAVHSFGEQYLAGFPTPPPPPPPPPPPLSATPMLEQLAAEAASKRQRVEDSLK